MADYYADATRSCAEDASVQSCGDLMWPVSPLAVPTITSTSPQRSSPPRRKLMITAVVILSVCALTTTALFLTQTFGVTTFLHPNSFNNQQSSIEEESGSEVLPIDIQQHIDAEISALTEEAHDNITPTISLSTNTPTTSAPSISPSTDMPSYTPTLQPTITIESMLFKSEADTFVEFNNPNPQGESEKIRVDGETKKISLIRFKTKPLIGVKVIRAELRLYSLADTPFGGAVDLLDGCNDWREDKLSWTNAPKCVFDDANTVGSFGTIEPNVWNTAKLTFAADALSTQVTLRLSSSLQDGVMYSSRQNDTAIPELIIDFHRTAAPTSSPTKMPTSTSPTSSTIPPSLTPYPTSDWPTFAPAT